MCSGKDDHQVVWCSEISFNHMIHALGISES